MMVAGAGNVGKRQAICQKNLFCSIQSYRNRLAVKKWVPMEKAQINVNINKGSFDLFGSNNNSPATAIAAPNANAWEKRLVIIVSIDVDRPAIQGGRPARNNATNPMIISAIVSFFVPSIDLINFCPNLNKQ